MAKLWKQLDWGLVAAFVLPLIAILPTLGDGIAAGADVEVHVHRIHAMGLALQAGELWPRWISYLHLGYGYPIFNFYAPGYAYITALFEVAGLHITTAYNLVQSLAWSFGSVGTYLLARRFMNPYAALLAAALWIYAPSRLYEVWWQGSLAQIISATFMPYLLLGVAKNSDEPAPRQILWITLPFAGLILTHTPMMYISAIYAATLAFIAPIWITRGDIKQIIERWIYIGCGFVLGIGLATIFLMPTLLELQHVLISQGLDETLNYLQEQYLLPPEIFMWPRTLDATDIRLDFPRTLGLVGGLLSIFGTIALWRRKQYGFMLILLAGLGFTVFMLLDASLPVWLTIPGFSNLRFPARLLRMGAVIIALLGGASLMLLPQKWQLAALLGGLILVIGQIMPVIKPYDDWLNWENISALDEIQHEATDYTWGTVSYNEFNPVWGERIFLDVPDYRTRYIDEPFHLRVYEKDVAALNWQGLSGENITDNTLRVITDEDRAVRFRQYYFPGWQATLNGELIDIYPDEQLGLITMDLAAGEHIVALDYVGTTVQRIATAISLVSLVIVFAILRMGKPADKPTTSTEKLSFRDTLIVVVPIIVFAFFNVTVIQPANGLKIQSPPDDPTYMATEVGAVFGEKIELLGYTLHDNSIAPNQAMQIDLYWRVLEPLEDEFAPRVQLINLSQTAAWAVSDPVQTTAGKFNTFSPDRFASDIHVLRLFAPESTPPFAGQISVQLIGQYGALLLENGSDRLLLADRITVNTTSEPFEVTAPAYQFGDLAQLLCADFQEDSDQITLDLLWRIIGTTERELVVMVHGLDADGNIITQGDGAPFDGNYPSQFWRENQILREQRTLANDPNIEQIAISLYTRDTVERLPVRQDSFSLPNNQIIYETNETTCSK